jgi:hypothetical protein
MKSIFSSVENYMQLLKSPNGCDDLKEIDNNPAFDFNTNNSRLGRLWYMNNYDIRTKPTMKIVNGIVKSFVFLSEYGVEFTQDTPITEALKNMRFDGAMSEYNLQYTYTLKDELAAIAASHKATLAATDIKVQRVETYLRYEIDPCHIYILNKIIEPSKDLLLDIETAETPELKALGDKVYQAEHLLWKLRDEYKDLAAKNQALEHGAHYLVQARAVNARLKVVIADAKDPKVQAKLQKRLAEAEAENEDEENDKPKAHQSKPKKSKTKTPITTTSVSEIIPYDGSNATLLAISEMTIHDNALGLPEDIWEQSVYAAVKTMLLDSGFVYKRNTFVHENAEVALGTLFELDGINPKVKFQFFSTTPSVEKLVASKITFLEADKNILEPSAGDGVMIKMLRKKGYDGNIDVFEAWDKNAALLAEMPNVTFLGADFLEAAPPEELYDLIVANPPFTGNSDIKHISKMLDLLRIGGRLFTICSTHFQTSTDKSSVRFLKMLTEQEAVITQIPKGAFKESGTDFPSVLICLTKRAVAPPEAPPAKVQAQTSLFC